jgi:TetR/AcrR family transcriptional repressor of nem operon
MRKSKADTAETRKRIIAVASNMFIRQGLGATSVADVMVASGLTQGGFYRHFESKEQLIAEASEAAFHGLFDMFDGATAGMAAPEALGVIIHRYLHQMQVENPVYMCPLANLSSELSHSDAQVKAVASEGYAGLVKLFASHLMRMHVSDYVGLAESIISGMVGAVSLSRMAAEASVATAILARAEATAHAMIKGADKSKALLKSAH